VSKLMLYIFLLSSVTLCVASTVTIDTNFTFPVVVTTSAWRVLDTDVEFVLRIRIIKLWRMRLAGLVAQMGEKKNAYR
jgi:hypothetical protein